MFNVLIIGLDSLSQKVIKVLKNVDCNILGFDFDVDKINSFYRSSLITNSPHIILNDLLKESDVIIINIEYSRYKDVFKLVPFIKESCLILDTNIYKGNINEIKKMLQNRRDNFIPCNFLLFPNNIILNYDTNTKMNTIRQASDFFHKINLKTSVLDPKDNDGIFCRLYQIPYLFEHVLFKNSPSHFVLDSNKYDDYDFFFNDIILNKSSILNGIKTFLSNIPDMKGEFDIKRFLEENSLNCIKTKVNTNKVIDDDVAIKILFEKIFIKSFISKDSEYYIDLSYLNFEYQKYSIKSIEEYYLNNVENVRVSLMIIKEKIISLSSFLQFDDISISKKHIKQFLSN